MPSYICEYCNYTTDDKTKYNKHCNTEKHKRHELEKEEKKKQEENSQIQQLTQQVMALTQLVQQLAIKPAEPKLEEPTVVRIKKEYMTVSEEKAYIERSVKACESLEEKTDFLEKYKPKQKKPKPEQVNTPWHQIKKYAEEKFVKCVCDDAIPQLTGSRWEHANI
jgi:myosin heavy subunit